MSMNLAGLCKGVATMFHTWSCEWTVRRWDDVVKGRQRFEVGENVTPKTSWTRSMERARRLSVW